MTEPSYIEGFVRKTRSATVEVRILPEHGDPRRLVELAKSERDQARARARQQDDGFLAYDEVWCTFDRDQHERFEDACQMARDNHRLTESIARVEPPAPSTDSAPPPPKKRPTRAGSRRPNASR